MGRQKEGVGSNGGLERRLRLIPLGGSDLKGRQ